MKILQKCQHAIGKSKNNNTQHTTENAPKLEQQKYNKILKILRIQQIEYTQVYK